MEIIPFELNTSIIEGDRNKPAVVFIHGLGMDKRIWSNTEEARIMGGRLPVGVLYPLAGREKLQTLYQDLSARGFTVITWTQKYSAAETAAAVNELREVINIFENFCQTGIILIGHSRGGLVARRYLELREREILMVITLASPHQGTTMARWGRFISPLANFLKNILPKTDTGLLAETLNKVSDFLSQKALKELLPASSFIKSFENKRIGKTIYLTVAGTKPILFSLYRRKYNLKSFSKKDLTPFFSIPNILKKIIPVKLLPKEMKQGKGDGLVSVESAQLPWADECFDFDVNHAGILFDAGARRTIVNFIERKL